MVLLRFEWSKIAGRYSWYQSFGSRQNLAYMVNLFTESLSFMLNLFLFDSISFEFWNVPRFRNSFLSLSIYIRLIREYPITPLNVLKRGWKLLYNWHQFTEHFCILGLRCCYILICRIPSLAIEGRFVLEFHIDYIPEVTVDPVKVARDL